ncbi:hypothetical protein [Brevibacterium aurantiacum]|uniref:hypothetical protein n=1 Tax=Brevibacterium aurantiacum TaxID=273384 RepID=UPI003F8E71CB
MSDQDELRDRIADVIERSLAAWVNDIAPGSDHAAPDYAAQAIIDEFGMTVRGDGCGYHEIYGSYDTRFGKWEKQ